MPTAGWAPPERGRRAMTSIMCVGLGQCRGQGSLAPVWRQTPVAVLCKELMYGRQSLVRSSRSLDDFHVLISQWGGFSSRPDLLPMSSVFYLVWWWRLANSDCISMYISCKCLHLKGFRYTSWNGRYMHRVSKQAQRQSESVQHNGLCFDKASKGVALIHAIHIVSKY